MYHKNDSVAKNSQTSYGYPENPALTRARTLEKFQQANPQSQPTARPQIFGVGDSLKPPPGRPVACPVDPPSDGGHRLPCFMKSMR